MRFLLGEITRVNNLIFIMHSSSKSQLLKVKMPPISLTIPLFTIFFKELVVLVKNIDI